MSFPIKRSRKLCRPTVPSIHATAIAIRPILDSHSLLPRRQEDCSNAIGVSAIAKRRLPLDKLTLMSVNVWRYIQKSRYFKLSNECASERILKIS